MQTNEHLRDEAERVKLYVGDMIYDIHTKSKGFLTDRQRRIDMFQDDIYVWNIHWFSQKNTIHYNNVSFIEEQSLKMSIVVGTIFLYSINSGV